ncbi:hypothetical protein HX882_13190 [Pseudomonas gingeri]|uniref:Uncharacterized protein n=1 Tax=Pseudomonas gingeri TaxID=117681 RepID=A0A7Y7XDM5_9PSED|nr:hypothetical protein [Pseudomonas gingeri]NWB96852.1 hypothetical protein [Pseudomonas gingeri]
MLIRWCAAWLLYLAVSQVWAAEAEPKELISSVVGETRIHVSEPVDEERIVTLTQKGSPSIKLKSAVSFDVLYTDPDSIHAPNMIVGSRSGGTHCCYTLHIISFSPSLHEQNIEVLDSDLIDVQAVARGGPTLGLFDFNFGYWHNSFAGSPAPPISLSWNSTQGRYVLNVDGMRKPAPSNTKLTEDTQALLKEEVDTQQPWPPTLLWADMLKYIYSGNSASARTLMDTAWQPKWGDKELFFTCFNQKIHAGRLWGQMDIGNLMKADGDFPKPISVNADCGRY